MNKVISRRFTNFFSKRVKFSTTVVESNKSEEKVKETFKVRFVKYWKNLIKDYTEVGKDIVNESREKPWRTVSILWGLGFIYISAKLNPDEKMFIDNLRSYSNDLVLVASHLQNPTSVNQLKMIENSINEGVLRRLHLGIFSLMWLDDYDTNCNLYKCTCSYLKPQYTTFHNRIIDVGFWNQWFLLDKKMIDYDINY